MPHMNGQRCPECKDAIHILLRRIYPEANRNVNLGIPARLTDYRNTPLGPHLMGIHQSLVAHRGFGQFVHRRQVAPVDFCCVGHDGATRIVEFDESQHFTTPRAITLRSYGPGKWGFSVDRWIRLCEKMDEHDNSPNYRDEQRSWYDTLRDFYPLMGKDRLSTVRIYARDWEDMGDCWWCQMELNSSVVIEAFRQRFLLS